MATARARSGPASLSEKRPFNGSARIYFDRGWFPMPLPPKKKSKPPTGFTGWDATKRVTQKQVDSWLASVNPSSNVALRPGQMYLGVDVDAYKGEGEDTYAKIMEEIGGLPDTWISSARDDGVSGIRHYRLPEGAEKLSWPGKIGPAIETIHYGHRYIVAPPSIHPEKNEHGNTQVYAFYAPGEAPFGVNASHDIPAFDSLTELPWSLVEYFTKGRFAKHLPAKDLGSVAESKKKVAAWIEARGGEPCSGMKTAWEVITDEFEGASAHDSTRDGLYRLACLSSEGHPGLAEAVSRLHDYFIAETTRDDRDGASRGPGEAEAEWLRFRDGAVKKVMRREDDGDFIGAACTCTGFTPEGRAKEKLDVDNYHISDALAACYDAVRARAETDWLGMYQMNGSLREVTDAGMRELSVNSLRPVVARRVDWIKWVGGDEPRPKPANPPKDFLGSMLEDSTIPHELPAIKALVKTPFWALTDGEPSLVHENGYHKDAQVVMNMDPRLAASVENMDLDPNTKWVRRAISIIDGMIEKFPFVADADRAGFYAALVLPFVRDLVAGPTPIHLIGAPVHGSGKTLLAKAISMVACGALGESGNGYSLISVSKTRDGNTELEKEVTTRMRNTPRVMVIDNIAHTIDSSKLASQITEYPNFVNRLMGGNNEISVPNRTLWIMTANNPTASDEIADRVVPIWIDPHCERPRDRTDDFKDLYTWIPEHRPALVWAVLTLVAHWVASGAPDGPVHLGSFDRWAAVVSGILECSGIDGLLDNRREFLEKAADDTGALSGLVQQWAEEWKFEEVRAADLLTLPASNELLDVHASGAAIRLGKQLKPMENRVVGDFTIRRRTLHGVSIYRLEKNGDA